MLKHTDLVVLDLTIDGEIVHTTPQHPFYTEEDGWLPAGELKVGMHVRQADGGDGLVQMITREQHPQVMYNLTVDTAHTFFVGDGQWLVHNDCADKELKRLISEFEKENGSANVHGLRRHGEGTTLRQQQWRAQTGNAPDVVYTGPQGATRFLDNKYLLEAYQKAMKQWVPGQPPISIPFEDTVAEGFYKGGRIYGTTNVVTVVFDEQGKIVTAYGKLPLLP